MYFLSPLLLSISVIEINQKLFLLKSNEYGIENKMQVN